MKAFYEIIVTLLLLCLLFEVFAYTQYHFKHYPYRKKQRNERKIRQLSSQCDSNDECSNLFGLDRTRCTRMCVSEECYNELYGHDELEEGEIDVRANSFKGCVMEKVLKP